MCRVCFYHHGAACRQSAGCIATRSGICKWKITGTKYHYRPQGNQHFADIGSGRIFIGNSGINGGFYPTPFAQHLRKHAELQGGPASFAC